MLWFEFSVLTMVEVGRAFTWLSKARGFEFSHGLTEVFFCLADLKKKTEVSTLEKILTKTNNSKN